jgi:hypothetical protein
MSQMDPNYLRDRLHRLVKLAIDTGEVATVVEAEQLFATYRLVVVVGPDAVISPTHQATLLTIVNAGRRTFLGGVQVQGPVDAPLMLRLPDCATLGEAVVKLGGHLADPHDITSPLVVIGNGPARSDRPFAIRTTFDGWSGGVTPLCSGTRLDERNEFAPAGVVAGALAVSEAFQYLRGSNSAAGKRDAGISLWRPELDWRHSESFGPAIDRLPSNLWLIGLGNLGQAYLWILGLLPYAVPGDMRLVLQDFDVLAESNDSTSFLTHTDLVGLPKTRAMAAWAEKRGFRTRIVERAFAANFRIEANEPSVALCGVDNALARTALEEVGFTRVIEAGLGRGTSDFLAFRTHMFPGSRRASDIWSDSDESDEATIDLPAYRALAAAGVDRCGLTRLAGVTVGAPFVGVIAASLVIGDLLRLTAGAHVYDLIDAHLKSLRHRTVIQAVPSLPFNPGSTRTEVPHLLAEVAVNRAAG